MSFRLPIFPLNVVLFPGATMPLHIFEPRYRQMLADCLADDRRFAIVPRGETEEAPAEESIGCTAVVRGTQTLPDGCSNIVVSGETRCVLRSVQRDGTPYLMADLDDYHDAIGTAPSPQSLERLRAAWETYCDARAEFDETPPDPEELEFDPERLSFLVAAAVPADLATQQSLLEDHSTARRVDRLLQLVPAMLSGVKQAAEVHRLARRNGRAAHRVELDS